MYKAYFSTDLIKHSEDQRVVWKHHWSKKAGQNITLCTWAEYQVRTGYLREPCPLLPQGPSPCQDAFADGEQLLAEVGAAAYKRQPLRDWEAALTFHTCSLCWAPDFSTRSISDTQLRGDVFLGALVSPPSKEVIDQDPLTHEAVTPAHWSPGFGPAPGVPSAWTQRGMGPST